MYKPGSVSFTNLLPYYLQSQSQSPALLIFCQPELLKSLEIMLLNSYAFWEWNSLLSESGQVCFPLSSVIKQTENFVCLPWYVQDEFCATSFENQFSDHRCENIIVHLNQTVDF